MVRAELQVGDLVSLNTDSFVRSVPHPSFHSRGRMREWKVTEIGMLLEIRLSDSFMKACVLLDGQMWWIRVEQLRRVSDP